MTLRQEIADFQKEMIPRIPQEVLSTIIKTSAELLEKNLEAQALKVGDLIPSFMLTDASGTVMSSDLLLQEGPLVISFYRGGWCPYCNLELRALQKVLPEIKANNATLLAISPESPDHTLSTGEVNELEFPVLSDPGNQVAKKMGLAFAPAKELLPLFKNNFDWDLVAINGTEKVELPFPATYVVDREGVIRFAFVQSDYTQRAEPQSILEVLRGMNTA
jgi:peroxiredoxin